MKQLLRYIICIILIGVICTVSIIFYKEIRYIPTLKEVNIKIVSKRPFLDDYNKRFIKKYLTKKIKFDENGVPIFKINRQYYYHPVYISQFALGAFEYYSETNNLNAKKIFLKCADWLKDNLRKHGNFFYWEYNFEIDYPGI